MEQRVGIYKGRRLGVAHNRQHSMSDIPVQLAGGDLVGVFLFRQFAAFSVREHAGVVVRIASPSKIRSTICNIL